MDWFSWLSRTNLDPSLVYEYGLAFARNELLSDDLQHFNHEFLQSMGVAVAKHRLEILKLAHRDSSAAAKPLSALLRRFNKYLSKFISRGGPPAIKAAEAPPRKLGFLTKWTGDKDLGDLRENERAYRPKKRMALSGPLNGRAQERLVSRNARNLKLSGPLDGKARERLMYPDRSPRFGGPNRSPKLSGPLDGRMMMMPPTIKSPRMSGPLDGRAMSPMGYNHGNADFEDHLIWAALFDDMKPT